MRNRPKKLVILAVFLILLAASFPIQIMMLYGHSLFEAQAIAAKIAPLNWAIMLLAPFTAMLAFRASPWVIAALPTLTGLVIYNNWFVSQMQTDFTPGVAWLASGAFVGVVALLFNRQALQAILNPTSRWWLTPERKRLAVPVRIKLQSPVNELYLNTFDLSEGGAFLPLDQAKVFRTVAVGTQCYVSLPLKDVESIKFRAEIVRNTQGRGEYPAGVGVKFLGLSWAEKRKLSHFLAHAA
jgi:hypothetical protein